MTFRAIALAGLVALSLTTAASAEEPQTPPSYGWGMMGQGWGPGMMGGGWGMMGGRGYGGGYMMQGVGGMGCGMMGYRRAGAGADYDTYVDGRLAFLKAELKITPAQEDVWNTYADALRTRSQVMASMHKQMFETFQKNDRSPVTFLDLHIQAMKSQLAALEALKPATEALYKSLAKEQREKADDILPVMGCM
jgi:hypothetical protein